jgi:hypothetical protein
MCVRVSSNEVTKFFSFSVVCRVRFSMWYAPNIAVVTKANANSVFIICNKDMVST